MTIGDNCIIGANSVASKNIASNSVTAGMLAQVICTIDEYYNKNKERGYLFETALMEITKKRENLEGQVSQLKL